MTQDFILTDLADDIVLAAAASDDDVGIYLRSHHIVEQAAEKAVEALYEKYDALGHDTLSKHLNALLARGADGPLFKGARMVAKHRRDFAHTRAFEVTEVHVSQVQQHVNIDKADELHVTIKGGTVLYKQLRPAHRYMVLCVVLASSLEVLGKKFRDLRDATAPFVVNSRDAP